MPYAVHLKNGHLDTQPSAMATRREYYLLAAKQQPPLWSLPLHLVDVFC
jgi:hypothetical protein